MIVPMRCFTCNNVITSKKDAFDKAVKDEKEKRTKEEILNDLGLSRMCCRTRVITSIDMMEII